MCIRDSCVGGAACINTGEGQGFLCLCPPGYTGDGRNSGDGCTGEILQCPHGMHLHVGNRVVLSDTVFSDVVSLQTL